MPANKKTRRKYHGARAMDKSARQFDQNGYMTIQGNPISKEGVYDYLGAQIPGYPGDPNDIVKVYRPGSELARQETIDSFKLMPFIDEHQWLGVEGTDAGDLPLTGTTGENVYYEAPYLKANLRVYSQKLLDAFNTGKVQLSPGYLYDYVYSPGQWQGINYSYVQSNLRGNHLALVEKGRTGADVAVMDSAIPTIEAQNMTLEELIAAINALTPEDKSKLAEALATPPLPVVADPAATPPAEQAVPAVDEPTPPPASTEPQTPPKAEDESEVPAKAEDSYAELLKRFNKLEKQVAQGMDSGVVMQAIATRNDLYQRVSKHTGAFAMDSMTTEQVAAYGLQKLKVTAPKGQEIATLNGLLAGLDKAPAPVYAFGMDQAAQPAGSNAKAIDDL